MNLASYAVKESEGRKHKERHEDSRGAFQRDKDRIIHCKAFRRLDKKTQVFSSGSGDHYRTRLTHTLEVAQIARDLARRLQLNEDLCEAIALAHDLGHPPFGHAGEAALNEVMQEFGLHFEHNEQSRRVVEVLEKAYPAFEGLNLTLEVLDGMVKHQTAFDQAGKKFELAAHLEAQVVNLADEIAYINHDMDDGLRSGLISLEQLQKFALWQAAEIEVEKKYPGELEKAVYISRMISTTISLMVNDLCKQAAKNLKVQGIKTLEDVKAFQGSLVRFSEQMREDVDALRNFLYENFYLNPEIEALNAEGQLMIKAFFKHLVRDKEPVEVKDYIAGMTDNFLQKEYSYIIGS